MSDIIAPLAYMVSILAAYFVAYGLFFRKREDQKVTHGRLAGFIAAFILSFVPLIYALEYAYDWLVYAHRH